MQLHPAKQARLSRGPWQEEDDELVSGAGRGRNELNPHSYERFYKSIDVSCVTCIQDWRSNYKVHLAKFKLEVCAAG